MEEAKNSFYIDFHSHLDFYKNDKELFSQLKNFSGAIVSASSDEKSFEKNLEIQKKNSLLKTNAKIVTGFGIHPMNAEFFDEKKISLYEKLCSESKIIGEIGMDFCWYDKAGKEKQEDVLRFFLEHCNKTKKFCVIHTKDAEEKICRILEDYPFAKPIIHWYDGPREVFEEFLRRDCYFTFGCETARSVKIQRLLKICPKEKILAETDNPDSEVWLGGSDTSIFLIKRIYSDIAKVLCISENEAANLINENSKRILENL